MSADNEALAMRHPTMASRTRLAVGHWHQWVLRHLLVLMMMAFVGVLGVSSREFMTISNFEVILTQISTNALLATGATFVILTCGIDLSVGSIVGLAGVVAALVAQRNGPGFAALAVFAGLLAGAVVGALNGALVAFARVPAFVATLGTMTVVLGVASVMSDGQPISGLSNSFLALSNDIGPIPTSVLVMVVVVLVSHVVLSKTHLGMHVYAVGGNEQAARVAGVRVRWVQACVYVVSGLLAGLAGVILASRVTAGIPTTGTGYELNAIAAAVIGGISLKGGRGTLMGTCIGFLIIGILDNGLNILNVSPFYQNIVKGSIIIGAVFIDSYVNRKKG